MVENELTPEKLRKNDNVINVDMTEHEIGFLKNFIKTYRPKKIVEVGVAAGGNTVNLLKWKDEDAQLISVDLATYWYKDHTKKVGFMVDNLDNISNWKLYSGYDYLDVYEKIGNEIDCIIIDTTHVMPGEFLTFLAALPQLKDGCIVILHDIHLNVMRLARNKFRDVDIGSYCTGLLFGSVSSNKKWVLKTDGVISNIGAFVVDKNTRNNINDIFRILCATWYEFPSGIDFFEYKEYIKENYSKECYKLFETTSRLHANYFNVNIFKTSDRARVDIMNVNDKNNSIDFINIPNSVDLTFPDWFKKDYGEGAVIESYDDEFNIKFKCINDGLLTLYLRGPDVRDRFGKRLPSYVNYENVKINNEIVLDKTISTWHDEPHIIKKHVKNGEIINIHLKWSYFKSPTVDFDFFKY